MATKINHTLKETLYFIIGKGKGILLRSLVAEGLPKATSFGGRGKTKGRRQSAAVGSLFDLRLTINDLRFKMGTTNQHAEKSAIVNLHHENDQYRITNTDLRFRKLKST